MKICNGISRGKLLQLLLSHGMAYRAYSKKKSPEGLFSDI